MPSTQAGSPFWVCPCRASHLSSIAGATRYTWEAPGNAPRGPQWWSSSTGLVSLRPRPAACLTLYLWATCLGSLSLSLFSWYYRGVQEVGGNTWVLGLAIFSAQTALPPEVDRPSLSPSQGPTGFRLWVQRMWGLWGVGRSAWGSASQEVSVSSPSTLVDGAVFPA